MTKRKIKFPANRRVITHEITYACEKHAFAIVNLFNFMGAGATTIPYYGTDQECMNCVHENESENKK